MQEEVVLEAVKKVPRLRFPTFRDEWRIEPLENISSFHDEKRVPIKEGDRAQRRGKYPYYGASGIIDYVDDYLFDGEFILLGEDGANIVLRNSPLAFVVSGKFWVNNHAHVLQANGSNQFLAEALERINYEPFNTGTAQPKLNASVCKQIPISLPSLPEQTKIAGFLSAVDGKIQQLTRKKALLEQYKKGVMQQLFSLELRFKREDGTHYPDWEKRPMSSFLVERNVKAPKSDRYPLMSFVAYKGVTPKGDRYDREFLVNDGTNKPYKQTEYGDFIYSSNNLLTGSIGLNSYGPASISPVYSIFQVKESSHSQFISEYLVRRSFLNKMVMFRQGVVYGQWRIHESDFLSIQEKMPCIEEQQRIAGFLSALDGRVAAVQEQLAGAVRWKKGLLQGMFV